MLKIKDVNHVAFEPVEVSRGSGKLFIQSVSRENAVEGFKVIYSLVKFRFFKSSDSFVIFKKSYIIKRSFFVVRGVVGCRLCPCVHVRNGVVQYAGVPNDIGSEDDMWNVGIAQFTIGWRTHSKVGKAILDIKWDDVAVRCGQALLATNLGRLVIDRNLEMFHLSARQYGLSRTYVCLLVHDRNGRSSLGVDKTNGGDNGYVGNLMIVESLDVNSAVGFGDDANIIASNATIGTSVNKSQVFTSINFKYRVNNSMVINRSIFNAVESKLVLFGLLRRFRRRALRGWSSSHLVGHHPLELPRLHGCLLGKVGQQSVRWCRVRCNLRGSGESTSLIAPHARALHLSQEVSGGDVMEVDTPGGGGGVGGLPGLALRMTERVWEGKLDQARRDASSSCCQETLSKYQRGLRV